LVHNINYRAIKTGAKAALPKEIALSAFSFHPLHCVFPFKGKIDDNAAFHRLASLQFVCVCLLNKR